MLQTQDLQVVLDAEAGLVKAIDGLSLAIERGETFALVGESGCGKSMTALSLMRLLPENARVIGGDVHLEQRSLLDLPESAMRRVRGARIAMIFQEPSTSLNPVMRVGDQILETIETHTALRGGAAHAKAVDWLTRVGIPEPARCMDRYPFELSGGQKQRVMIAIALGAEPDFLVADEPTTALDVTIQKQILDLLVDLQRERRLGMLLITHDLAVVSGMAHRVALMYAGQIVEVAPADCFFQRPRHPYANLLLKALPDAQKRGDPLAAIQGHVPPLWQRFEGCRFAPRCHQAQARCHAEVPELLAAQSDLAHHQVRCFFPLGLNAGTRPSLLTPHASEPSAGASGSGEPVLQVRHLSVVYVPRGGLFSRPKSTFTAVDDVSLTLRAGQTLALVGESGCGKTTFGRAILQLLRNSVQLEGQALLNGDDLFKLQGEALRRARRDIQIVFQDPFASLNPRLRVRDILEEGLRSLRPEWLDAERQQRLQLLMEQVGLRPDALSRFPHEFSGGQRQRLAIARALAVEPKVLVCDEPTSALDVSVQAQILNLLKQLQAERGLAYLFITHNLAVVEYLADEVAVMRRGRIVETGAAHQVLSSPQDSYTQALLAAVPRLNPVWQNQPP
ncbi:ABC transporter ATP-binding protein [Aquabacterium sp. CECT 9606]|uniref:ABC transporter ATP-binding protein n=1 Tax=Aquabacterium sp. CECT 9606 TaxID=2845822 RepID=UPI001E35BC71|nr:ABC transporter ATP-binding protein [Aquabacterium sp. CECT 9606]CAH0355741.1 putative ABC transporter ATP-binding protein [Aquabacterium sp. CECT 9606]